MFHGITLYYLVLRMYYCTFIQVFQANTVPTMGLWFKPRLGLATAIALAGGILAPAPAHAAQTLAHST